MAHHQLPAFSLQPIVENAIKHGTSQRLGTGKIVIQARRVAAHLLLTIEDNAGLYQPQTDSKGLGMKLVDKRLRAQFGDNYGISIHCEQEKFTRIYLRLPLEEAC